MIGLIRAEDLDRWASRITTPPEFPRLVRLLVSSTASALRHVDFPADEAVRLAGWDGKVLTDEAAPFVPAGFSAWELGTSEDVRGKANDDYEKRTRDPVSVDPKQTTFVFATPRRWPGKEAWATEKRAEGRWKNVLAFDAESFVQWLENAPGVAAWIGPLVGAAPRGARSLEVLCDEYRTATKPPLDVSGVLIGRDNEKTKLLSALNLAPQVLEIAATTHEEAAVFVGACIHSLPEADRDSLWARSIWIDSADTLPLIAVSARLLVVVVPGDIPTGSTRHHWIRAVAGRSSGAPNSLELGAQPISALIDFVTAQGLERNDAYQRCQEAGGHLERVRRTIFATKAPRPEWASPSTGVSIAASILIGEWDESVNADKATVAAIAGVDYEQFVRAITPFVHGPSPLVTRAGTVWKVYNRSNAWRYLEQALTTQQLEAFLAAAHDVLLEADPRFELAPEERWMANVHGKKRNHSGHLRTGLAQGLVHAAVLGRDDAACYAGRRAQAWIDGACYRLFKGRSQQEFWRQIRGELQEFAEASPDQFLTALESDLDEREPQVLDLFQEEGEHGACLHADLLWALEILAWAPEYVGRAALALAALAERDPGGRWGNRPRTSLAELLLPWRPQSNTSAAERKDLLHIITRRHPKAGWELGKALMPTQTTILTPSARPKLRHWAPEIDADPTPAAEYWAEIQDISERLLELCGTDSERWHFLLSSLNSFMPPLRERVLSSAEAFARTVTGTNRLAFRERLRKLLHHHNQFAGDEKVNWVYSTEILARLETLYASLEPEDPIDKTAWLFSFHVERPTDVARDWKEEQAHINSEQAQAAETLATSLPLTDLINALPRFENQRLLGYRLGQSSPAVAIEQDLLRRCANSAVPAERDLAQGFALARYESDANVFVRRWCSPDSANFLSEEGAATVLQALPAIPQTWDAVDAAGPRAKRSFWKDVYIHLFGEPRNAERAARSLLEAGRALAAIDLLAANVNVAWLTGEGDVRSIVDALRAGVAEANTNPAHGQRVAYDIATLIKRLAESQRLELGELMNLEWIYFGVLQYQAQHDLVIYQHLISEPELLLQLISLIYIPEGESKEDRPAPSQAERDAANQAWSILHDWKPFARTPANQMLSPERLRSIVERIRTLAAERRHSGIVDDHLGKALASAPAGTDGVWPHESVRAVLEAYPSEALMDGFVVGRRNLRGITTRSPADGGQQERDLTAQYAAWQRALAVKSPRTSALLGRLAEEYRTEANREDVEVRKR